MQIAAIVACTPNGVTGKNNTVPWYFPEDLKRFKKLTTGHTVIMGRKTYESLGKRPLRGRTNIVLSSQKINQEGIIHACNLDEAIYYAESTGATHCFLIGGQRVYEEGLCYCSSVFLTRINMDIPEGESFFPIDRLQNEFICVEYEHVNTFVEFMKFKSNDRKECEIMAMKQNIGCTGQDTKSDDQSYRKMIQWNDEHSHKIGVYHSQKRLCARRGRKEGKQSLLSHTRRISHAYYSNLFDRVDHGKRNAVRFFGISFPLRFLCPR